MSMFAIDAAAPFPATSRPQLLRSSTTLISSGNEGSRRPSSTAFATHDLSCLAAAAGPTQAVSVTGQQPSPMATRAGDLPRLRTFAPTGRLTESSGGRMSESGGVSADKAGRLGTSHGAGVSGRASESGDKPRPSPPPGMRRASTMIGAARFGCGDGGFVPCPPSRDGPTTPSTLGAQDRNVNALQQDKHALMVNKRRLEALLTKLMEQQQQPSPSLLPQQLGSPRSDDQGACGGAPRVRNCGGGGVTGAGTGGGGGALRAQVVKALEDSSLLDRQLGGSAAGRGVSGGAGIPQFAAVDSDARIMELQEAMQEMKLATEVAVSRLEGELKYRNTQAAAAAAGLQKQLAEAEEELTRVRRLLGAAEGRVRELRTQDAPLRRQVQELSDCLADKVAEAQNMKDLMGMDKVTMHTVNDMLRHQLRDAHAATAAQQQRLSELERAVVQRDTLLAEAQQQLEVQRAAVAAAGAAADRVGAASSEDGFVVVGAARGGRRVTNGGAVVGSVGVSGGGVDGVDAKRSNLGCRAVVEAFA